MMGGDVTVASEPGKGSVFTSGLAKARYDSRRLFRPNRHRISVNKSQRTFDELAHLAVGRTSLTCHARIPKRARLGIDA
jgi:hypothetical protein